MDHTRGMTRTVATVPIALFTLIYFFQYKTLKMNMNEINSLDIGNFKMNEFGTGHEIFSS